MSPSDWVEMWKSRLCGRRQARNSTEALDEEESSNNSDEISPWRQKNHKYPQVCHVAFTSIFALFRSKENSLLLFVFASYRRTAFLWQDKGRFKTIWSKIFMGMSGENKQLIHLQCCRFSHLQRIESSVISMVGSFLWEKATVCTRCCRDTPKKTTKIFSHASSGSSRWSLAHFRWPGRALSLRILIHDAVVLAPSRSSTRPSCVVPRRGWTSSPWAEKRGAGAGWYHVHISCN